MGRIIGKVFFPPEEKKVKAPPVKKEEPMPEPAANTEPIPEIIEVKRKLTYTRKSPRKIEEIYETEE